MGGFVGASKLGEERKVHSNRTMRRGGVDVAMVAVDVVGGGDVVVIVVGAPSIASATNAPVIVAIVVIVIVSPQLQC